MANNELKVAIIPYDIVWADKDENLMSVSHLLRYVDADTDIVVLPEMFTTGFITDNTMVSTLAETNTGKTIDAVHRWADFFKFAICGSFIASTASGFYNRAFFIEPSGDETFYDKKHLFSIGGESKVYNQGDKVSPIVRFRGWNIKFVVCYDVRFPMWCRNIDNNYDVMIATANWPTSRSYAWNQLLIARAIENQSYVVGANRSGKDDYGTYSESDSVIIDYKGNQIGERDASGIIYAQMSQEKLLAFRTKFPVWKDADRFQLI